MHFLILGDITHIETFATGSGIREIGRLRKLDGQLVDLHWYEATVIDKREVNIKRFIEGY